VKSQYNPLDRKKLKLKMASAFGENIQTLPMDMQKILLDDLVTAFENRLKVLNRIQSDFEIKIMDCADYETVKA
jgi:hypothetical protein